MNTSPMLKWSKRYLKWPFITAIGVMVFLTCFNDNNAAKYYEYDLEIERLRAEITMHEDTLLHYRSLNDRLGSDPATMERIVREKYHMQRPNEDVYVFTRR
ncbi:MAG: septum formation initiator family protein [Muribaculaceae bacterium]|nr:septum formation initiator family protein [Muribaculaceae bacterium]